MKKSYLLFLSLIVCYSAFAQPDVSTQVFATGFDKPVGIKHAGDDRLFIVEQSGVIKILNANGSTNSTPFLDINSLVVDVGFGDERGLLGLAFHPNYSSNGFFYVYYINNAGSSQISRFSVSANPDIANTTETPILSFSQPNFTHNGGELHFGNDGYLYIASGDGGTFSDSGNYGQRLDTFLGKILRLDVDGGSPYAIPSDNPFANDGDANTFGEIWHYGFRNPWKFSFDRLTGDLWIADVGQSNKEEINMVSDSVDGLNFGWRCYEGNSTFNTSGCPNMSTLTFPIAEYDYGGSPFKCAITGGYRYRGSTYTDFDGLYFFADFCSGQIGYLEDNGSSWDITWTSVTGGNWSAFGEDVNGELYATNLTAGIVYSVFDANALNTPRFDKLSFKMYPNPAASVINFEFANQLPKQVQFYDLQGKLVQEFSDISTKIFSVSTKNLTQGLYIVEAISTNGQKIHRKLIVN